MQTVNSSFVILLSIPSRIAGFHSVRRDVYTEFSSTRDSFMQQFYWLPILEGRPIQKANTAAIKDRNVPERRPNRLILSQAQGIVKVPRAPATPAMKQTRVPRRLRHIATMENGSSTIHAGIASSAPGKLLREVLPSMSEIKPRIPVEK
jgi:hypothetical protein